MKINKLFLVSILLLAILALGVASASEDISDDAVAVEPIDEITIEETEPPAQDLEENEDLSLSDFKAELESDKTEIVLENDYKYSGEEDTNLTIDTPRYKPFVLDGQGHTIDGAGTGITIYINSSEVVIKNLIFRNFQKDSDHDGGFNFIYLNGYNCRLENCTFENIINPEQGALLLLAYENITLSDCTFKDNSMRWMLRLSGSNISISNCNFTNNYAAFLIQESPSTNPFKNIQINDCNFYDNNATDRFIVIGADHSQINNSTFVNNHGGGFGYVTYQYGNNSQMNDCTFENNYATAYTDMYGAPIARFGYMFESEPITENVSVTNVTFRNNVGIPIEWDAVNGNVTNCVFINNNGTIRLSKGEVYRDNGIYDFEVTVYNDTIVGAPEYPTPIPYPYPENILVEVHNYGQMEGNVVILLNDTECYNKKMESDSLSIKLDELDTLEVGDLNIVVKFVGDEELILYNDTTSIDYYFGIIMGMRPILYPHGTLTLNISLPKQATGTLILNDGIGDHVLEYADGSATYTLNGTDYSEMGFHTITLSLTDDAIFPDKKSGYQILVDPKVNYPDVISEGETAYVFLDLPDDYEGNFVLYNMTEDYEKGELILNESVKGICKVQLPVMDEGGHGFILSLTDLGEKDIYFHCIKNVEGIDSSLASDIIFVGDDAIINLNCQLSNCSVVILVDENGDWSTEFDPIEINETESVLRISDLALGEHVFKILISQFIEEETPWGSTYLNTETVYSNTHLATVMVKPVLEIIPVNSSADYQDGEFIFKAIDSLSNEPFANTNIIVEGVFFYEFGDYSSYSSYKTFTTDADGIFKIKNENMYPTLDIYVYMNGFAALPVANYTLTFTIEDPCLLETQSQITVNKVPVKIIAEDIEVEYGSIFNYSFQMVNANTDVPIKFVNASFRLYAGIYEFLSGGITDENGIYTIPDLNVGGGIYYMDLSSNDTNLDCSVVTKTLTITNAPKLEIINATIDNVSGVFQLKLLTADDEPVFQSIIALEVNGEDYLGITDKKGIANFVLRGLDVGNYTARVSLDGYYSGLSQDVNLEVVPYVAPRKATQIVYSDMVTTAVDVDTDGRIGEYFKVILKDAQGNPLVGKRVQIGFNGVIYNRTTNETGGVKLQINLQRTDIYTFAVAFLGDDEYNGSFAVAKITVNTQKGSLTVPNKSYSASAKTKSLTATFKSASGKVVANKKVTFTVNGKSYSAVTNSKGVATVNVSLNKKGTYSFTAKFAGDGTYAAISKSAKLTIK